MNATAGHPPAGPLAAARPSDQVAAMPPAERLAAAWAVLDGVMDPEVPVISLRELGIVRGLRLAGEQLQVVLTPTYSGCPATEVIQQSVVEAIAAAGLGPVAVLMQRAPAWTTDWISDAGRDKLRAYGIAPPAHLHAQPGAAVPIRLVPRREAPALRSTRGAAPPVPCPRCNSARTERLSAFGATACKALYRCLDCREPFEHFKPI